MARLRVATVITRLQAGGGGVALRGALALDRDEFEVTIVTGGAGLDGHAGEPRTTLAFAKMALASFASVASARTFDDTLAVFAG